jgi:hypothetical protein
MGHHGEVIQMSRVLARFSIVDDTVAEARRAREEEWRAMHRRPDAPPEPRPSVSDATGTRFSLGWIAKRVTGPRPGS